MLYKHKGKLNTRREKHSKGKRLKRKIDGNRKKSTTVELVDLEKLAAASFTSTTSQMKIMKRNQTPSLMAMTTLSMTGASRKRLVSLVSSYTYEVELAFESGESDTCVRLMRAIENNNLQEIAIILQGDINPLDLTDFFSQTNVLHMAARFANKQTLELLFNRPEVEQLVNTTDIRGTTPLIAAAWYENLEAVEHLLAKGADTQAAIKDTKKTALHFSADLLSDSICMAILRYNKKKLFLDAVDSDGNTALMIAVGADSPCIDILFKSGSDYRKKNLITERNILHQAIVNGNSALVRVLVTECFEKEFIDSPDNTGATPFMTAIRLENEEALKILLESQHVEMILPRGQLCLHGLVEKGKVRIFKELLDMIEDKTYFNFIDDRGRTVLLNAVENGQVEMLKAMIDVGVNYKIRNYKTGETILHVAAYSKNHEILNIVFALTDISELMMAKDHSGLTPCEIILGQTNRSVWRKFVQHGLMPFRYFNDAHESSLFIAAKKGNYHLVMTMLLSEKFNHLYERRSISLQKDNLSKLELQGLIYTSDVYLLLGYPIENRKWQESPEQEELFDYNATGQNIFHACALGKNLNCLLLIYEYCHYYKENHLKDLDRPDINGNSPLVAALRTGYRPICKFLMKHGADLSAQNRNNRSTLEIMIGTLPDFQSLFIEVINECVVLENTDIKKFKDYQELKITYDSFCPPGKKQMAVFNHIFNSLRGKDNIDIVHSPVLEYFVMCKWSRIERMMGFRFTMYAMLVVLFSTYISFDLCTFLVVHPFISEALRYVVMIQSFVMTIFSIPLMYFTNKHPLTSLIVIAAPILIFAYMQMDPYERLTLEIGAAGVLFGWFAILIQGSVTRLSFQIAMFFQVVRQVTNHLPICLIMLYAFSNCCFVLFHDFLSFNNPLHAFITISVLLLHGENELPVFNPDLSPLNNKKNLYKVLDNDSQMINGKTELRGMLVEGVILLVFDVLINICFLNMLVGLAVREGGLLELEGFMYRARTYVKEILAWEMFVESRFYKIAKKLKILWLMGVPSDLKEKLLIPTVHTPLSETYVDNFNLQLLREAVTSVEKESLPTAKTMLYEERFNFSSSGIMKSGAHVTWIYNEKRKFLSE